MPYLLAREGHNYTEIEPRVGTISRNIYQEKRETNDKICNIKSIQQHFPTQVARTRIRLAISTLARTYRIQNGIFLLVKDSVDQLR